MTLDGPNLVEATELETIRCCRLSESSEKGEQSTQRAAAIATNRVFLILHERIDVA